MLQYKFSIMEGAKIFGKLFEKSFKQNLSCKCERYREKQKLRDHEVFILQQPNLWLLHQRYG